jgi:hypothetical protein
MQAAMVAALEAAALRRPINLIGISHATGSSMPRKRLLDYAEQGVQWVAERLVAAGVDRQLLHVTLSVQRDASTLRTGVQLRTPSESVVPSDSDPTDQVARGPANADRVSLRQNASPVLLQTTDEKVATLKPSSQKRSSRGHSSPESRVTEALRTADAAVGGIDTDSFDLQSVPAALEGSSKSALHPYCGHIALIEGSLRLNIENNISRCGYAMGRWHFYRGNSVVDWLIDQPITTSSESEIDGVLAYFALEYNILWRIRGLRVDFAEYRRDL